MSFIFALFEVVVAVVVIDAFEKLNNQEFEYS